MNKICLGIGNYYGTAYAVENDGKFYLELEDWNGLEQQEISEDLFRAIKKEFSI